jgi:hypothetical protein
MHVNRRSLFALAAALAGQAAIPRNAASEDAQLRPVTSKTDLIDDGYRLGPPPILPPLPPKPYPYTQKYLFTDGRTGAATGQIVAMFFQFNVRLGVARKIPYGLDIQTDEQKLWLLGRKSFAQLPSYEQVGAGNVRDPYRPSWGEPTL